MSDTAQTRTSVHCRTVIVTCPELGLAAVHADSDTDWPRCGPRFSRERALNVNGSRDGVMSVHEHRKPAITLAAWTDMDAGVTGDDRIEQHVVASEGETHRPIGLLPQGGAALHVRKEERDRPARQLRHAFAPSHWRDDPSRPRPAPGAHRR